MNDFDDMSADDLRRELGLEHHRFVDAPSPRPVDRAVLRALHRGELDPGEEVEVLQLIADFREWYEADRDVDEEEYSRHLSESNADIVVEQSPGEDYGDGYDDAALREYLSLEYESALGRLCESIGTRTGNPLAPYAANLRRIVCEEWGWRDRRNDARYQDSTVLARELAAALRASRLDVPFPIELLAVTLIKYGLDRLCGLDPMA